MRLVTLVVCAPLAAALLAAPACKKDAPPPSAEEGSATSSTTGATPEDAPPEEPPPPPAGRLIAPEGEHFEVRFPAGYYPSKADQPIPTAAGELKAVVWTAEGSTDAFVTSFTDMPKELLAGSNADTMVRNAANGALGGIGGTSDKEEHFKLEGYPGLRVWYHGAIEGQPVYGRIDAVFVPPRLYQTIYLADNAGAVRGKRATDFFDSFRLVGVEPYGVRVVKVPDGGFEIAFPASYPEPTRSDDDVDVAGVGKMKYVMFMSTTPKGAVGAGYMAMPPEVEMNDAAFDNGRDGMLKSMGATLAGEEKIERDGRAGRAVRFKGELEGQAYEGKAELVAGDGRVHIVLALTPSVEQLEDAQVTDYFASLKIGPVADDGAAKDA
ncbi:MAG: hypothetical protein KC635_28420, partial [Myxococcales bacterium]|nr:hypothetical protein [Myxococcales bacterium]